MASTAPLVLVERKPEGYATVTLQRKPVNSLNLELFEALTVALDGLEKDPKVSAVIFRSGLDRDVFTAGNDINELYAPHTSKERYTKFWVTSNSFFIRLFTSRLATVAAIRGACPAGGCLLSLACDHRVMTDFGAIGLNEVALGISVPKYWMQLMERRIGAGQTARLTQFAIMLSPQEALRIGLVDEVVTKPALEEAARTVALRFSKSSAQARGATKAIYTTPLAEVWRAGLEEEAANAWGVLTHPSTVASLKRYIEGLKTRKQ